MMGDEFRFGWSSAVGRRAKVFERRLFWRPQRIKCRSVGFDGSCKLVVMKVCKGIRQHRLTDYDLIAE